MVPSIDDNGSDAAWPEMVSRFGRLVPAMGRLDDTASRRVMAKTMIAALGVAAPHDAANVVSPVMALWQRALGGDEPASDDWGAAMTAARGAAARAAWTAAWAARAEVWTAAAEAAERAAWTAAWAARAEVWTAARASHTGHGSNCIAIAEEAMRTARAAAWDRITDAMLSAIEDEG
jgi:type IV secretory pathway TrbL component